MLWMCLVLPYSVPSLVAALTVVSKDIRKRYNNTTSFLKKVKPTPLLFGNCMLDVNGGTRWLAC